MTRPERIFTQAALLASGRLQEELHAHLSGGGLVAYPTASVYGYGGLVRADALSALQGLKAREGEKPFLLLTSGPDVEGGLAWDDAARRLRSRFWPGPLTLILPDPANGFPTPVRGDTGGVAVRWTSHLGARAVLAAAAAPLTSSSANAPGARPALDASEVLDALAEAPDASVWVMDGGRLPASAPSTLVDCTGPTPRVVREGIVPASAVEAALSGPEPGSAEAEPTDAGSSQSADPWARPIRLLFVCTGNTCRSPMAEAVARERIRRLGWSGVEVASAGVWAGPGHPASPEAVEVAGRRGYDLAGHHSRPITDAALASDLILTMGPSHLEALLGTPAAGRVSTLGAFADGRVDPFDGLSVADPIGMGVDMYDATIGQLEVLIGLSLGRLAPLIGAA